MNDCGISKLDLKRRNRMQILKVVREQGPISRVDISAILGITRAAVTIITNEMIDQHILEEVGEEPVNPSGEVRKGRRKILLDINETYKFAVGIYVDEKEVSIGLTTLNAAALDKQLIAHEGDMTPEKLVSLLDDILEKMLQNSCLSRENLLGIGVGIMPSAYEMMGLEEGTETCPVFPALQKALEDSMNLPVYINSAVMEFAMAGLHYNEIHAKAENQVFLYWDSGSYHAIPINGNTPLLAAAAEMPFIERLCVDPDGRAMEGYPRGSVRAELSAEAVADKIRPVFSEENTPALFAALNGDLVPAHAGIPADGGRDRPALTGDRRRDGEKILRDAPGTALPVRRRTREPLRFRLYAGASGTDPQNSGGIRRRGIRPVYPALSHR